MGYDEIRRQAKKRVNEKKGFYVTASVFAAISVILLILSFQFDGDTAFWIRFPILVLALVLGIIYVAIFGVPITRFLSTEWEEEEIEREMIRLYRERPPALPSGQDLTEQEILELQELERLQDKWYGGEEFV